jgi:glycosyltransferase involved in cell wall biosynthesis
MAEAIGRLLADRPLAAALGARAQERARDFSWPRAARAVADVLVDAAGRK